MRLLTSEGKLWGLESLVFVFVIGLAESYGICYQLQDLPISGRLSVVY